MKFMRMVVVAMAMMMRMMRMMMMMMMMMVMMIMIMMMTLPHLKLWEQDLPAQLPFFTICLYRPIIQ